MGHSHVSLILRWNCCKFGLLLVIFIELNEIFADTPTTPMCGTLQLTYECQGSQSDAKIKLIPSEELTDIKTIRWFHFVNGTGQAKPISNDTAKYTRQNLELIVVNFTPADTGKYLVDCIINGTLRATKTIDVDVPDSPCTETTRSETTRSVVTTDEMPAMPTTSKEGTVLTSTVVAVIAVCSTIVVLVVSGTVVLVMRQKKKKSTLAAERLVSHDAVSVGDFDRSNDNAGSVYHEIDTDFDYAKVHPTAFDSSKLTLLTIEQSPSLPRRPDNMRLNKASHSENDYATLDEGIQTKGTVCKSSTNKSKATKSARNFPECADVKKLKAERATSSAEFPEYAKVKKVKKSDTKLKPDTSNEKGRSTEFRVVFPYINCEDIFRQLSHDKELGITNNSEVKYSNLVSRNRRSKTRASRKELQYAVLDHVDSDSTQTARDVDQGLPKTQYATIDFEKKAFIAPVRKAPSSWYKRRKKKTP